jgi:hypothetical protein
LEAGFSKKFFDPAPLWDWTGHEKEICLVQSPSGAGSKNF